MSLYDLHDLSAATFDEFVTFYFDNPRKQRWSTGWSNYVQVIYEPTHQASCFIELFQKSNVLFDKYDLPQINDGLWLIKSEVFDGNAYTIVLEDNDVPITLRLQCISAMYDLFKDLFAVEPLQAGAFWWDPFAGYNRGAIWKAGEGTQLADTIFETLLRILRLESDFCQGCAVGGLEKLRHRNTAEELTSFLRQAKNIDAEIHDWINEVIEANPPFPQ